MGEYESRATCGMFVDALWGSAFLFATIIFLFVVRKFEGLALIGLLFSASITIALFSHFIIASIPKRVVINDVGIFIYRKDKLLKKIYWNDVNKIVSSGIGGRYPRAGITIYGKEMVNINDRSVIGPRKILKEMFREMASIAFKMGIKVEDYWGWASDIIKEEEIINPENFMGRWYYSKSSDKDWLITTGIVASLGILVAYLWTYILPYNYILVLGGAITAATSLFLFLLGIYGSLFTPTMIYFDKNSVKMRFLIGKEMRIPLWQIKDVRCFEGTGIISVCLHGNKCYSAKLSDNFCKALKSVIKNHRLNAKVFIPAIN